MSITDALARSNAKQPRPTVERIDWAGVNYSNPVHLPDAWLACDTCGHMAVYGTNHGTDEATQRAFLTDTLGRDVDSRASLTEAEGVAAGQRLAAWKRGDQGAAWGGAA